MWDSSDAAWKNTFKKKAGQSPATQMIQLRTADYLPIMEPASLAAASVAVS
jgi:hypothetical protein